MGNRHKIKCRYCSSDVSVRKKGVSPAGHQRYKCEACNRCFQAEYVHRAYQPGLKERVIEFAAESRNISRISLLLKIDKNTVSGILRREQENQIP